MISVSHGSEVPNTPKNAGGRPPRAVVGSTIGRDEEMFGAAFDRNVVGRFFTYVHPYRKRLYVAILALFVFTGAQLAIPLVIRHAIDKAIIPGGGDSNLLGTCFWYSVQRRQSRKHNIDTHIVGSSIL